MSSAIEIIGNHARTEILRHLAMDGPLTSVELAARIGSSRNSAYKHLGDLENAGLVTADLAPDERPGRTVRWTVEPERVRQVPNTWLRYALAEDLDVGSDSPGAE